MSIESSSDWAGIREAGRVVALTLAAMNAAACVGITTAELDAVAALVFRRHGAQSAPQLVYGFPGTTCISVNDEIVHGIPSDRRLAAGDVVKLDVTAEVDGYIADAATTVLLPPVVPSATALRAVARAALWAGLRAARADQKVSVIGKAIQFEASKGGVAVIRELTGHGVGRTIHEHPAVPNFEDVSSSDMLTDGLVIAVEPMFAERPSRVVQASDGWTIRTRNGCLAVHEEHTIVITRGGPIVLTAAA